MTDIDHQQLPAKDREILDGLYLQEILITKEQIHDRIRELGAQITRDYAGKSPLLIGVLKGAFMFMSDLSRRGRLHGSFFVRRGDKDEWDRPHRQGS